MRARHLAQRALERRALELAGTGALLLAAEAARRAFPVMGLRGQSRAYARYLATKPGAPIAQEEYSNSVAMAPGHLVFREGRDWFYAQRFMATGKAEDSERERLKIYALSGGSGALLRLKRAVEAHMRALEATYVYERSESGWHAGPRNRVRPLSSVTLPAGVAEGALRDMRGFLSDEAWYAARFVPYRRGYLFHGPPGTGKTTLAGALAHELGLNAYALSLADRSLNDASFASCLQSVWGGILILEDVDAVGAPTTRRDGPAPSAAGEGLTLAGILNALDGLSTPHGLIVVMTSNHPERLDPALIRPGRVDYRLELGFATREQAEELYRRFYPGAPAEYARAFAERLEPGAHSPAAIQEHFIRHRDDPELAAQGLVAGGASC